MPETLLKYPLTLYAAGEVVLAWPWWAWLAATAALLLASWWLGGYRGSGARVRRGERLGMALLRGTLLGLLLAIVLQPVLVVAVGEGTRGTLLMLIDESRSMSIADDGRTARAARLAARLGPGAEGLRADLESRFDLRWFAYGGLLRALDEGTWPDFDAPRSDLAGALRALADGPARAHPAGVVLMSDGGADDEGLDEALLALRARGVPVHVLAVGETRTAPDLDLQRLSLPARVLAGDSIEPELVVAARATGSGARLEVDVGDSQRLHKDLDLPADGRPVRLRVPLSMDSPGLQRVTVSIRGKVAETLTANNVAEGLVEVLAAAPPTLHYEGEPRFEVKFLRRALSGDSALPLVSLVRTADNKFYRLGVESDEELADGFPHAAADLYRFGVLVMGASAAAALDADQLRLVEDFVGRRGGALVLLGAPRDGGRWPATVQRLSPLPPAAPGEGAAVAVKVRVAERAGRHPLTRFLAEGGAGLPLAKLPPLTLAQPVPAAKPGASVLLLGERLGAVPAVVLAWHRYGRGRVVAFPVRDSWRWRLNADVPPEDLNHETLWRQMLRWLAREVPAAVTLEVGGGVPVPGVAVPVRATLRGGDWQPLSGAHPLLQVVTPLGDLLELPMRALPDAPGEFETEFVPPLSGAHELRLSIDGDDPEPAARRWLSVSEEGDEFHAAVRNDTLLRRVAEASGGSFRTLAEADGLGAALRAVSSQTTRVQRLPLWDVPLLYLLALLMLCGEWSWRRWRRLP